jgi:ribosome recycling factor
VADPDLRDIKRRMDGAQEALRREFAGLRTGRASASLLEPITVTAYGAAMPLNRTAELGLNPSAEGQLIRVPIPALSEERRVELTKIAGKYAEQARVAVRNVRRDGMEMLKRMEKEHEISNDEHHLWSEEIQTMTDDHIKAVDAAFAQKEEEILQV